ncbi:hypothetical protein D9M71_50740 [compost metagenome]
MLHIALGELSTGGAQQMAAGFHRVGEGQRHAVLQLVAEAIGAARLVERRPRADAAGQRLVEQPAIEQDVHRPVRRAHLHRAEQLVPMPGHGGEHFVEVSGAIAAEHCPGIVDRTGLAEEGHDLDGLADAQLDDALQGRAGIEPGATGSGQRRHADQRQRRGRSAMPAEELAAVGGPGALPAGEVDEGDPAGERHAPRIARQQCAAVRVQLGLDERSRRPARSAQHPFHIVSGAQPARPAGEVAQGQAGNLQRIVERHVLQQIGLDGMRRVAEAAVAEAMGAAIDTAVANRLGGGAPQVVAVLVADVENLAQRVRHRVVGPRRELVLAAVLGPGVSPALGGNLEAEGRVGDHVDPRRRGGPAMFEDGQVLAALADESAQTVEELHAVGRGGRVLRRQQRRGGAKRLRRPAGRRRQEGQLGGDVAAMGVQHQACRRLQQGAGGHAHQVGAQGVDHAAHALFARARLVAAHQGFYRALQVLDVGRRAFVDDDQVDIQTLHPPVLVGPQQLAEQRQVLVVVDAQQDDRQVAGNRQRPQPRLAAGAAADGFRRGAETHIGIQQRCGQALVVRRFLGLDIEIAQLHLGLGPGQGLGTLEGIALVVLVDQREQFVPRTGHQRPERGAHHLAGRYPHALAQAEDRVEYRALAVRQRAVLGNRQRVAQPTAPAEEARAVGFELRGGDHLALDHREVRDPDRRFLRRTRTAGGDQRAELGQPLGLHEQLGEGRVRIVGGRRREHQFGIGGEFDIAGAASVVGQGDLAYLAIVLAGDQHFETGGQRVLALQELGVMFLEEHFAAGHFRAARLQRRRPHRPALGIAQEDEAAPVVTRRVLAPARHGDVAPAAVA